MNDKSKEQQHGTDVAKARDGAALPERSSKSEISAFLKTAREVVAAKGDGRLIFALDATMSRQPTWDLACQLQGEMFRVANAKAGLSVQLVYYRGLGECRSSRWTRQAAELGRMMEKIDCRGGQTQIGKVLRHAAEEAARAPVHALVFIGDAMEENVDRLCVLAGELKLRKVPCFMFQEGHDPLAESAFREIARVSGGAHVRFDRSAAAELASLLQAVATFASGGRKALEKSPGSAARLLLSQLPPGGRQ